MRRNSSRPRTRCARKPPTDLARSRMSSSTRCPTAPVVRTPVPELHVRSSTAATIAEPAERCRGCRGDCFRMKLSLKRDKRPKVASPDDRMTLTEHLAELRSRIIRCRARRRVGIIIVLAAYEPVLHFLARAVQQAVPRNEGRTSVSPAAVPQPARGLHDPACRSRTYGGIILALPGHHVADLAVHRAGAARQGEEVRHPVRALVGACCSLLGGVRRLLDARQGARVPDQLGRLRRARPTSRSASTSAWSG